MTAGAVLAFASLHLFLYPAATAFNSVYDKDEGPVGGMAQPPPVPPHLRALVFALTAVGGVLALFVNGWFVLAYALSMIWTGAYSHPLTRWKASPWKSAAAIGLGQGVVGFLCGWAAAGGEGISVAMAAGAASAALTALGLYPLTQVYQVEEDSARGDRTLAVVLGQKNALRFGNLCLLLAAAAALVAVPLAPIAGGYAALILMQERLLRKLPMDPLPLHRSAMRLVNLATAGFLGLLLFLAMSPKF